VRVIPCEQKSAAWLDAKRGKVSASRIACVLDQLKKGGEGATRRNYRIELVAERLSGRTEEHYVSPEMLWGIECEEKARTDYEIDRSVMVEQVGFVLHPEFDFAGASPDGLVDEDGAIEIKCGKTTTHIKWMLAGVVPEEHEAQCLWVMACTGRKWCDFVSYDPRLPDGLKTFIVRMPRDENRIMSIEAEVMKFNDETEALCSELRKRVVVRPSAPVDTRSEYDQLMALMDQQELIP